MGNIKTNISKEHFMTLPSKEQNYVILSAVEGHEERITILEKRSWTKHPLSLIGGIIGGIIARVGLG